MPNQTRLRLAVSESGGHFSPLEDAIRAALGGGGAAKSANDHLRLGVSMGLSVKTSLSTLFVGS